MVWYVAFTASDIIITDFLKYQDVDTLPLRSPATWIEASDVTPWVDTKTGKTHEPTLPLQILLGIEGDNDPDTDKYWRMGYTYPVQLTQWALASAPNNPILTLLLSNFHAKMSRLSQPYQNSPSLAAQHNAFALEDPLTLAGPAAVTLATQSYLSLPPTLLTDFTALSGLADGGRSKAVGSTMIFPITAFSPGRGNGTWENMGSKPLTHADARVWHRAQGSWKHFDVKVELGKLCRTMLGGCRAWSKVPSL